MSRKPRTLVVTLAASSFSSLEPAATFCLSRPAIVSLADLTAWVPGPVLAAAVAGGAAGWAIAGAASPSPSARSTASDRIAVGAFRRIREIGDCMARRDFAGIKGSGDGWLVA